MCVPMSPAVCSLNVAVTLVVVLALAGLDGVQAAGSAVPASLMRKALLGAKKSHELHQDEQEPEGDKEPWTRYAFMKRIQESGVRDLSIDMPETFSRFLEGIWRSQVWQVHDGRFGKGMATEEAQYSNVICNRMKVKNITLNSQGMFGESTGVRLDMASQCLGSYCWQKMGWVSRGDFQSFQDGKLDVLFPPTLPPMGELGPFSERSSSLGENNGWCAPDTNDWSFDVDWVGKGPAGRYEDLIATPSTQTTFQTAVCRSLRRKISLSEDDLKFFESPPFKCGKPWLPTALMVIVVLANLATWNNIYASQVSKFEAWQAEYLKTEHQYEDVKKGKAKSKAKAKGKAKAKPAQ